MSEKTLKGRVIQKHDVESNWSKASFIPKKGEIIIYDIDDNYSYERIKVGDGAQNVNALPFVTDALETSTNSQITIVSQAVLNVASLVGDTPVSEQIADANMIYVGPDRPTDPNIKVWINTAEEGTGIVPVLPRVATISLPKASWVGNTEPYSQVVSVNTATSSTKIDLQPTAQQIVNLQNAEVSLMVENNGGVVTCYAIGNKPTVDYTIQVLLQEVSYV